MGNLEWTLQIEYNDISMEKKPILPVLVESLES